MEIIIILGLIDVAILGGFAILRTIINYKTYSLQKKMLEESRTYWGSWKERSKDVAEKVLSEISTKDLEEELKERRKRRKEKSQTQASDKCEPSKPENTQSQ